MLGKWWGVYRIVPRLAILPGLLVLGAGLREISAPGALVMAALEVALVLAYGAVVTGLGLLIAIAQPRPGRAVALMVAVYLGVTVGYPAIILPAIRGQSLFILCPSPFFGPYLSTTNVAWGSRGPWEVEPVEWLVLLAGLILVGLALLGLALATFDRGLGRARGGNGGATR